MKLFYRTYGSGNPLLIIHGLFGMSDNWITLGKKFSEHFQVIIPDLRNHGNSPHSSVFDINALTNDIFELIQTLQLENVSVIGHSLGGRIAISLALQHPEKIRKLVVVDIAPRAYSGNKNIANLLFIMNKTDLKNFSSLLETEKHFSRYIQDKKILNLLLKNIKRNEAGYYEWKINLKAITANIETLMQPVSEKKTFNQPALFLKGELSDFVTSTDEDIIYKFFPKAIIKTIKNAGHWVHADQPAEFFKETENYLLL